MLSAKQYLYSRCRKGTKSTSRLIKHFNACTKEVPQTAHLQIHYKLYNDQVHKSDEELENGSQLLEKTNYIVRDVTDLPNKSTS